MLKGTVKFYNETKGFGFIGSEVVGGEDVFVHFSAIINQEGFKKLTKGDVVEYELATIDGQTRAQKVNVVLKVK